ncbi:metal ABC transporter permease [Leptospira idonii]|uniref:Metal ABC transporter permease n=1 Tax=Leptospira idonii TaxID=1193500 RepID=A0A4R9LUH9_9LEPT|nr:metal ABC transporter permease [Leptospira idonii]TGN17566.1 metal ABC transporter permease [Leptospira idonii]
MTNVIQNWDLFLPQMIVGGILGALLSVLGILLVLRNMTFFGVTLSQAVGFSVAFCLFMGWDRDLAPILLSSALIFPIVLLHKSTHIKEDVVLGILFVFFASLSQILLALGGDVQNHLMASYFGDILTSEVKLDSAGIWIASLAFIFYLSFFRRFLFLSFDRDEYRIQIGNPIFYDILFYMILSTAVTVSVNLLGSFYSIAHLLLPVFTLLPFVRSTKILALLSILFSLLGTIGGFFLSLTGFHHHGEEVFFPTSSTIILFMCILSFLILTVRSLIKRFF